MKYLQDDVHKIHQTESTEQNTKWFESRKWRLPKTNKSCTANYNFELDETGKQIQNIHARIQTARICDNILLPEVISHLDQIPFRHFRATCSDENNNYIIFNYHFHKLHVFLCISVSFVAKHSQFLSSFIMQNKLLKYHKQFNMLLKLQIYPLGKIISTKFQMSVQDIQVLGSGQKDMFDMSSNKFILKL